jgi:hypothetical protein
MGVFKMNLEEIVRGLYWREFFQRSSGKIQVYISDRVSRSEDIASVKERRRSAAIIGGFNGVETATWRGYSRRVLPDSRPKKLPSGAALRASRSSFEWECS